MYKRQLYFYDTTCSKTVGFPQSRIRIVVLLDHRVICELLNSHCRFANHTAMIQYSPAFLQAARVKAVTFDPPLIADDIWMNICHRTKRGCCSGVNERARRRRFKPALPSIIMGNVQSLRNKPDELETCVRYLHEFREASLLCLTDVVQ